MVIITGHQLESDMPAPRRCLDARCANQPTTTPDPQPSPTAEEKPTGVRGRVATENDVGAQDDALSAETSPLQDISNPLALDNPLRSPRRQTPTGQRALRDH
ncbi:hypothetical protein DL770_006836 [Monosporascus sp. CRB-9-2]|nr:hypothetical protein DL770_006836 [Monosporascus sp. CRB-9-2]